MQSATGGIHLMGAADRGRRLCLLWDWRRGNGPLLLALLWLTALMGSGTAAAGDPAAPVLPTVVSTDLCSDLLLLRIGAPEQILSLSPQSRDQRLSPFADAARAYPSNRGTVEDLLHLQPDIALVYQGWTARRHADLLDRRGTRLIALPYPRTWAETLDTARRVAAEIGRGDVGEARVAEVEQRMDALAARGHRYKILYLRSSGGSAGKETYVDELFTRLGLRNLAAEEGLVGWGRFPLERLITAPPDLFLLGYFGRSQSPARSAYGRHPVLRGMLRRIPTMDVPTRSWGCGGLELVEAAERIAAQIDALSLDPGSSIGGSRL